MRKIVITFVAGLMWILLAAGTAAAQNPKLDSLRRVMATGRTDSVRAEAAVHAVNHTLASGDTAHTEAFIRQGLALAKQAGTYKFAYYLRIKWAMFFESKGQLDAASVQYHAFLSDARKHKRYFEAAEAASNLFDFWRKYSSDLDSSLSYANLQLRLAKQAQSIQAKSAAYGNLGLIYRIQGRYPEAVKANQQALRLAEQQRDTQRQGASLASLAVIYDLIGDAKLAESHYLRAIELFSLNPKYRRNLAITRYNFSVQLENAKRYDEAEHQLQAAYELALFERDLGLASACRIGQGSIAHNQNRIKQADSLLAEGRSLAEQSGETEAKAEGDATWAVLLFKKGQVAEARRVVASVLPIFAEMGQLEGLLRASSLLYQCDSALGDFRSAFFRLKEFIQYRDSSQNERNSREIGRLEAQYEAQKEREILEARQAATLIRRNWMLGSAGLGLFMALVIAFTLFRGRQKEKKANTALRQLNQQIVQQKAEIEAQHSEITAQRDQLETTNERLVRLDRMKEELTGMIVHDLKNPLNAVLAMASLPPDTGRLQVIRGAGQQMANLVTNLLDVQKYENDALKLQPETLPAHEILKTAAEQTDFLAQQKNIRFDIQTTPQLMVEADRELLVRVCVNLLTNAIKYAPNGDTLILEASYDAEQGAVFRITDHGRGIPADQVESIFDKFSQVDGGRASGKLRSTGLGLTFCKLTTEAHGGTIRARSEVGKYTTLEFNLPIARLDSGPGRPADAKPESAPVGPLPAALQSEHTEVLDRLRNLPPYSLTAILDALDELPNAPELLHNWKTAVEAAVLAADAARLRELLA